MAPHHAIRRFFRSTRASGFAICRARPASRSRSADIDDTTTRRFRRARLRLDLAAERVADRRRRPRRFAQQSAMARRVQDRSARPDRGRHLRLRLRDHWLHRQRDAGRRGRVGAVPRKARQARHQADARLRAEPHRTRSSLGEEPSRLLRRRRREGVRRRRRRITSGWRPTRARRILAYGRDPNYPGWPDTLQLNYANPALQTARIGGAAFRRGQMRRRPLRHGDAAAARSLPADLGNLRRSRSGRKQRPWCGTRYPGFTFIAEVYWDLEWTLQQQGFDYCYDKRLYDRLKAGNAGAVRGHLLADLAYQDRLARFLENHDEPRAAFEFPLPQHRAAAIVTFLSPGLRFFHQGQFEGARVRVPAHLCRGPVEPVDQSVSAFYAKLLPLLMKTRVFRDGAWSLIEPQPAWHGNWSSDGFIASAWSGDGWQPRHRRRQLRARSRPMPPAPSVRRASRQTGSSDRSDGNRALRSRRRRYHRQRPLHRSRALALQRLRAALELAACARRNSNLGMNYRRRPKSTT